MRRKKKQQTQASKLPGTGTDKVAKDASFRPDLGGIFRKQRPRGRPWRKGVSGNPSGRPKGARNKLTLAVLEGIRRAEAELARPKVIDREKPYESWDGYVIQEGLWFAWDPLLHDYVALPHQEPPRPPVCFDPGARRPEMTWQGRTIYVQHGWPFDPATWRRLRL